MMLSKLIKKLIIKLPFYKPSHNSPNASAGEMRELSIEEMERIGTGDNLSSSFIDKNGKLTN